MKSTLIRPGLLVSLKTTIKGGVRYEKQVIEAEHQEGAATVATWQTKREITDKEEHERAVVARGKARNAVTRVCCASTFGLLCPAAQEDSLSDAILDAQEIAEAFNRTSLNSRIEVYAITGRVADNDEQAARAIGSEVRDLIASMERAVKAADPEAIRDAANRARAISGMLGEGTEKKVTAAIAEVRRIARDIVSRVEKGAEVAADVVKDVKLEALQSARFAVLDMLSESDQSEQHEPTPIAGRAVDFEPEASAMAAAPAAPSFDLF